MADQLSLALSSGEAPDIVSLDCTKVPYFASIGAFAIFLINMRLWITRMHSVKV